MQISGVSLTLTWPRRLCLLRVLLCASRCYKLFLSKHTGGGDTAPAFSGRRVYLQFTWEVGLPPSSVEFSSHCHFCKLPAPGCWTCAAAPALSGLLLYLQFCEGLPLPPSLPFRVPLPLCYVSFLLLPIIQFFFFPWVGVGLSRGLW
jgi:hypothetical protein